MEIETAVDRLAALAQGARLRVFRLLVRTGPEGLPAGEIAVALDLPPQTLSFHLKHLSRAGLIEHRRAGRSLIYSLRVAGMRELLAFLSEDCCQGRLELCVPMGKRPSAGATSGAAVAADTADTAGTAVATQPSRPTVLFLCSKNSARSQMAEVLLRDRAGDRFLVHSAGLRPEAVHPMTLRVLGEIGLDTSACRAKDLGEFLGKVTVHQAIIVCERANQDCAHIYPFALQCRYWPFEDPAAFAGPESARLDKFRAVRDAIDARIRAWLQETSPSSEGTGC